MRLRKMSGVEVRVSGLRKGGGGEGSVAHTGLAANTIDTAMRVAPMAWRFRPHVPGIGWPSAPVRGD